MTLSLFGNTIRNQALSKTKAILTCLLLMITPTAMASEVDHFRIETIHARAGTITSASTKGIDNRVYVSGQIQVSQPYQPAAGAHVDVYLLNAQGQTLARQKDAIIVTSQKRDRTRGNQFSYAVSFDDSIAAQAIIARVVYCPGSHNDQG